MFTAPLLQVIKDCCELAIANGYKDEAAQQIADFCDTNIKATCDKCGGDGMADVLRDGVVLKDFAECTDCGGTGKGPVFEAMLAEMGERNTAIQTTSDGKLNKARA